MDLFLAWASGPLEIVLIALFALLLFGKRLPELAKSLGKPTERHPTRLIRFRDPSVESQERRHFGGRVPFMPREGLDAEGV